MKTNKYDVIIVGAGPAGSTIGYLLAKKGKKVLVVDKENFPRKKLCGGLLTEKNINLMKNIFGKVDWNNFIDSSYNSFGIYHNLLGKICKYNSPVNKLYFVNREIFDKYLLDQAISLGCIFLKSNVVKTNKNSIITDTGEEFFGDFIVGADGTNSVVRKNITSKIQKNKFTTAFEIEVKYSDLKCFEKNNIFPQIYFGNINNGYAWVFPKKNKVIIGIGGLTNKNNIRESFLSFLKSVLKSNPKNYLSKIQGFPVPLHNFIKNPIKENTVLIGDAAGLIEPITGEGIYFAMVSGYHAAQEILSGKLNNNSYKKRMEKEVYRLLNQATFVKKFFFNQKIFPFAMLKMKKNDKYCQYYFDLLSGKIDYIQYVKNIIFFRFNGGIGSTGVK